jgi:intein/homing endonuclease
MTGVKDVYEYDINENKIICTDNHKFYVGNNTYKEIKDIKNRDDYICIRDNKENFMILSNIKSKYKGQKEVYSISVEEAHEYFANNILVRNSDASRYGLHGWKMDNRIKGQGHYILERSVI